MILGVGNDVVQIPRIEALLKRYKHIFADKICTKQEQTFLLKQNASAFYAKRYAAKEAAVKAMGIGFRQGISFHDIEVLSDHYGKPSLLLSEALLKRLPWQNVHTLLSLSDDYPVAFATVIIERV